MKKYLLLLPFLLLTRLGPVYGQGHEVTQLILNYQKLRQLEKILENMYEGYEILRKGYNTVKDIAEGNFTLHDLFLDRLYAVNPAIRDYYKVAAIIEKQSLLLKRYQKAYGRFSTTSLLSEEERGYISSVYSQLHNESIEDLEALLMVVTASRLRMSDAERLTVIDELYATMDEKLAFLKAFNDQAHILVQQRVGESSAIQRERQYHHNLGN
ncbi:TerB family tellurite resistance protein [Fulvivirga maritima]|uniref:TerB family tellurite resistance protein n=1 Tax=Fulvivirga maritima TaxID=2904247 RepID=UPI001F1E4E49|nr:TerB family tellurite resistance protein [Fulvivirga maritima]UII29085.1 TerB family tellurite resistance protein [Fulvivirga maritima]